MRALPLLFLLFLLLTACASMPAIPTEWATVPEARKIDGIALGADGQVTEGVAEAGEGTIRLEGGRLFNGEKVLTEPMEVESFDVSESRGEVVFSARRDGGYDVGLVSTDGSPISWIPPDPADEVMPRWAPRGNKVSYVLRAPGGDVVRTVHVPTAYQLTVPFPQAAIRALAWDPAAERYAVTFSSLDASDGVEVLRYGGEERRVAIPPERRLDVEVEPIGPDAFLLRPRDLAYGEKLPVVVWLQSHLGWSDARAALMERARVACLVTTAPPPRELQAALAARKWIDPSRIYFVGVAHEPGSAAVSVIADAEVPPGRYRRNGAVVAVSPAVVQSFAAGFIPEHLKRTTRPNGRSR